MNCEKCKYYDVDRNDQPCYRCNGVNFEEKKHECTDCKYFVGCEHFVIGRICNLFEEL